MKGRLVNDNDPDNSIPDQLARYRAAAVAASRLANSSEQNRAADELHSMARILRSTPEGRDGILQLLADGDPYVRLCAATDALKWDPERACDVLEELVMADGPGAFDAKWTLRLFREGTLNVDY